VIHFIVSILEISSVRNTNLKKQDRQLEAARPEFVRYTCMGTEFLFLPEAEFVTPCPCREPGQALMVMETTFRW
jgi:hypothetical protein